MTPWHIAILITVALAALVCGFSLGIVILGKRADKAMAEAIAEQDSEHFTAWLQEWERKSKEKQ